MLGSPSFWNEEEKSLLMKMNADFITPGNAEEIIERAKGFKDLIQSKIGHNEIEHTTEDCEQEEILRMFQLDAERTFKSKQFREKLVYTLKNIWSKTQDYHQGMGFICSFLLLFLEPSDTISIILSLDKYYIPGYFKARAQNYFRDAKVFGKILGQVNPKAFECIGPTIAPETYCSKWFIGLNVHVLPFGALISFIEAFLQKGDEFLFKFGLSLIDNCQDLILSTHDVSKILAILRLDQEIFPIDKCSSDNSTMGSFFTKIVDDAITMDLNEIDIEALRTETELEMSIEEEKRKKREAEMRALESDDEIVFSDEEIEDSDGDLINTSDEEPSNTENEDPATEFNFD